MQQNNAEVDSAFSALVKNHIRVLAESIKISSSLPVGSARTNFITCFPEFSNDIKPCSDQLEEMMSTILKKEGFKANIRNYDSEDKVDLVVDGVNKILDRVKRNIDTLNGVTPAPEKITESSPSTEGQGSWNSTIVKKKKMFFSDMRPTNMPKVHVKPQLSFDVKVDNSKNPFKPSLIEKPNALKPLALQLERGVDGIDRYNHPYLYELNFFSPPTSHLHKVNPIFPWNVDDKPEIFVDTVEGLKDMMEHLKEQSEIAVDLEHHEYRSFQGFTCLMQISSRKEDYIIDAIKLRKELVDLNKIFTDPGIVKVFHGAELDVEWLQKDLSLYVVNMFDTFFAARHLNLTKCGLAFLLERYCNLKSDKQYQLYDWRIRPLGKEAQAYARSDTHYLLYVYDRVRNDLIEKANGKSTLVEDVFFRATQLCKKRYEKPPGDESGFLKMYKDSRRHFNNQQLYALQHLYMWRDEIARREDESYRFVLPNHQMLRLAELLPRDRNGILGCCVPLPSLVRKNLGDLQTIIFKARQQPLQTSETQHFTNSLAIRSTTLLSKLRSPHDFSHYGDIRDDLATLLDGTDVIDVKTENEAQLTVFNDDFDASNLRPAVKFLSPYERFKKTTEFVLAQEQKNRSLTNEDEESEEEVKFIPKSERHLDTKQEEKEEETNSTKKEPSLPPKEAVKIPDNVPWKRKAESLSEQIPSKKLAKSYEVAKSVAQVDKVEPKSEIEDDFPKLESDANETIVEEKKTEKKAVFSKAKKRKKTENTNNEFVAHDYSAGNYNKFTSGNKKNVKQLLSSKISFGANKNKKNRQKFQHKAAGVGKAKK